MCAWLDGKEDEKKMARQGGSIPLEINEFPSIFIVSKTRFSKYMGHCLQATVITFIFLAMKLTNELKA